MKREGSPCKSTGATVLLPSRDRRNHRARHSKYVGLFIILRFMARRQAGHFGPADLLVIVLIADVVLVMTIVAWEYIIDWLTYRFAVLRPILRPPSLTVIKDGRVLDAAMRKELLSMEELLSQLR
jgi:uncharacterized membrane protein YcaP (DUF421 family)